MYIYMYIYYFMYFLMILFIFRERGREGEREGEKCQCVVAPMGTWPTTRTGAPTGNRTINPFVGRPALNQLSHSNQGLFFVL